MPEWAEDQDFADDPEAVAGAELFAESGCTNCHTYLGAGSSNLGAPDLTRRSARRQDRGVDFQIAYVDEPGAQFGNTVMPPYAGARATEQPGRSSRRSSRPRRARTE